jgi:membrane-bound serine protease (ClpP class)
VKAKIPAVMEKSSHIIRGIVFGLLFSGLALSEDLSAVRVAESRGEANLSAVASVKADVPAPNQPAVKAAVIVCKGLIDDGLYKSIQRRTQIALDNGAKYLIYEISTYGGMVESADNISKYLIFEVGKKAHTAAYITTEAISAGAMISVSCKDIIMKENTTIGDCSPIVLGGKLEGVEREKMESFIRSTFNRAAEANGYPPVLLKAMVSIQTEVYRVKNLQTGSFEFFEGDQLPKDVNEYDLDNKELIDRKDELLTLTATKALEYGIARAKVNDLNEAIDFLAKRDGVVFARPPMLLETNWSEEMVRWVYSPAVMGILVMLALLGAYVEFQKPGLILPALVAVVCFVIIIGSRYLTGLANWLEIILFIVGVLLLLVEIFVLPGFAIAGVLGVILILAAMFGMLIKNKPNEIPWPETQPDWLVFKNGVLGLSIGFIGFIFLAMLLARYLPKIPVAKRLVLKPPQGGAMQTSLEVKEKPMVSFVPMAVQAGQKGITVSQLRPAGKANFGGQKFDVVSRGELIEADTEIIVVLVEGNRIVVRELPDSKNVI